jgi:predicted dehydrogenase
MVVQLEPIKLAIIGCGAIAQERYLPAAALVPHLTIAVVTDLDAGRARDTADRFRISQHVTDYRDIFGKVDAVVVATPPRSHAPIAIDCLEHGLHVLCEKPLATSSDEVTAMIAAGRRAQRQLAVGMNRRVCWSSQTLKRLMQLDMLGEVQRFDLEEGNEFNWPLRTAHIFQDSDAGGVLFDAGVHVFDLLLWALDGDSADVTRCRADNWGGVETNALVDLTVERRGRSIPGRVELSFTRKLRNTLRIYGEKGRLEASTLGNYEMWLYPDGEDAQPVTLTPREMQPKKRVEEFALQLSNFVETIAGGTMKVVTADEALATIALIEHCRRARERWVQPWEIKHLESFFEGVPHGG